LSSSLLFETVVWYLNKPYLSEVQHKRSKIIKLVKEEESHQRKEESVMSRRRVGRRSGSKRVLWFDELSTREAGRMVAAGVPIILPVGSVEEHGEHLPLCTDSVQPEYVALRVAERKGCLVAPPLRYGVCGSARNFAGTISVGFDALRAMVYDVLEEFVRNGFRRLLVVSGHAGQSHMAALRLAAESVVLGHDGEGVRVMVCSDYDFAYELRGKYFSEKDGHAGAIETSRVMAIRPDLVKRKGKASHPVFPRFEVVAHAERYFPSGVIGDPGEASRRKGQMANEYIVDGVCGLIDELRRDIDQKK
jgi:creatinine amidohydrolase